MTTKEESLTKQPRLDSADLGDRYIRLLSEHCWAKGDIIYQWHRLTQKEPEEFARVVGSMTDESANRLYRTFVRFSNQKDSRSHLLWAHYNTALEWPDAEYWLDLAQAQQLSSEAMKAKRWKRHAIRGGY